MAAKQDYYSRMLQNPLLTEDQRAQLRALQRRRAARTGQSVQGAKALGSEVPSRMNRPLAGGFAAAASATSETVTGDLCAVEYTVDEFGAAVLLKAGSEQVMMEWERPYMEACIRGLQLDRPPLSSEGSVGRSRARVLEIGFGLGFSANAIQTIHRPAQHVIVELHPVVAHRARKWASSQLPAGCVTIAEGSWQEWLRPGKLGYVNRRHGLVPNALTVAGVGSSMPCSLTTIRWDSRARSDHELTRYKTFWSIKIASCSFCNACYLTHTCLSVDSFQLTWLDLSSSIILASRSISMGIRLLFHQIATTTHLRANLGKKYPHPLSKNMATSLFICQHVEGDADLTILLLSSILFSRVQRWTQENNIIRRRCQSHNLVAGTLCAATRRNAFHAWC
eukprot:SAG31_NODE_779_length_12158_cov_8.740194_5_plen_393_part_00